ncbi:MAG: D-hexose-6-phosphate mutarotase [Pseudomonas sp.]|uniref:D-hexose-6-phosphate mutarotase n=1 Tax=Pseudomonas sp. TaxID=306 RepID=UPI003D0EE3B0
MATTHIERIELGELTCWRVRRNGAELLVSQQGAQLLSYQLDGEPPLIWLSEDAAYTPGQSVRGGAPICWPWFGDLRRNPLAVQTHFQSDTAPSHGLVRALDWQLLGIDEDDAAVTLKFLFDSSQTPLTGWPIAAQLHFEIRLGDDLRLTLETHNLSSEPLTISQALHSYFAVSDIHQARVEGLPDSRYIDTLDDWHEHRQDGDLHFSGETDRIYLDTPSRLSIVDPGWNRRIILDATGSRSAVLWNPWIDKSERLSQFANDAWQRMLCIETANVLDDALVVAPGERRALLLCLSSEPIGR